VRYVNSKCLLIGFLALITLYGLHGGGLSIISITKISGYLLSTTGALAFLGGMKKEGAAVTIIGIVLCNLPMR